jgi:hypothetical protein
MNKFDPHFLFFFCGKTGYFWYFGFLLGFNAELGQKG